MRRRGRKLGRAIGLQGDTGRVRTSGELGSELDVVKWTSEKSWFWSDIVGAVARGHFRKFKYSSRNGIQPDRVKSRAFSANIECANVAVQSRHYLCHFEK